MRSLLAGAVALFGVVLGLDAYGYRDIPLTEQTASAANADAAMMPDSGSSGVGYGE